MFSPACRCLWDNLVALVVGGVLRATCETSHDIGIGKDIHRNQDSREHIFATKQGACPSVVPMNFS